MIALYEITGPAPRQLPYGFEVIRIRIQKSLTIKGKFIPEHEAFPLLAKWGEYGFSYLARDRAGAERRFAQLVIKEGKRNKVVENALADVFRGEETKDSGQGVKASARSFGTGKELAR